MLGWGKPPAGRERALGRAGLLPGRGGGWLQARGDAHGRRDGCCACYWPPSPSSTGKSGRFNDGSACAMCPCCPVRLDPSRLKCARLSPRGIIAPARRCDLRQSRRPRRLQFSHEPIRLECAVPPDHTSEPSLASQSHSALSRVGMKLVGNHVLQCRKQIAFIGVTMSEYEYETERDRDQHQYRDRNRIVGMARSDLIVNLVIAGIRGDPTDVRTTAEAIAADERAKKHTGVAERIIRALDGAKPVNGNRHTRPGLRLHDGSGGVLRREPSRPINQLHLDPLVRQKCYEFVEEQHRADILRAHGIEPRHRILLTGPPGNGKTSLAEALAYELALPLFTVRYEAVVTSYLGETAQRLRRLFDFVRTEPCLLFFDEFDAIGKERGDIHETGEIKRVVTTLLLQLDDLPSYCVLVGATNHPELLDRATWRRFELRLNLDAPTSDQMTSYFSSHLATFAGPLGYTAKRLFEAVSPKNYSEAEAFFLDVKRRFILAQGARDIRSILDERVKAFTSTWDHSRRYEDGRSTDTQICEHD